MDEAIKAELARLRDEDNRQNHRIDDLEQSVKAIQDLTISVHALAQDMRQMLSELKASGSMLGSMIFRPIWARAMENFSASSPPAMLSNVIGICSHLLSWLHYLQIFVHQLHDVPETVTPPNIPKINRTGSVSYTHLPLVSGSRS